MTRLMRVTIHRGKLGEDKLPVTISGPEKMTRDRIVRRLVPLGHVSDRAPYLPLQARRLSLRPKAASYRGEDAYALGYQFKDSPHRWADVSIEHRGLVATVAPNCATVPPPA